MPILLFSEIVVKSFVLEQLLPHSFALQASAQPLGTGLEL